MTFSLPKEKRDAIDYQWEKAIGYFRSRGSVLFLSDCRFWEQHGFVQQSLARTLVAHGVRVRWLDGAGWRRYRPVVSTQESDLVVKQLPSLPGRRFARVDEWSVALQARRIHAALRKLGGEPVIWVQSGIDERLAAELPRVDVFSVFDDPHKHDARGVLCQKARLVLCQNTRTAEAFRTQGLTQVQVALPPIDLEGEEFTSLPPPIFFPRRFPDRRMGYLGSFFYEGFDFELLEEMMLKGRPWGFLLVGRTDEKGKERIERLSKYTNFHYVPWIPRKSVAPVWGLVDVCLMPYRWLQTQDGAFATKAVEALHYRVPSLATHVPKTEDLAPWFPRGSSADELLELAMGVCAMEEKTLHDAYAHFAYETHPKLHLSRVAERLIT